jgi:hypothetical protein
LWRIDNDSQLTISAGLDGSLNVADALDGDAVLVVAVDELVLELTDLVDEHAELVGDIGNVVIETLAPDGKLLLRLSLVVFLSALKLFSTYSNLHTLATDKLHGAHDVLLHLHELRELLCEIGTEGARVDGLAEVVAWGRLLLAWLRGNRRI